MFIDLIVFILLIVALFKGLRKGFIVAIFSLLAFIIGLAAAIKLSAVAAAYLGDNINVSQRWLPVLAFLVVFVIVVLLVRLGAKALEGFVNLALLGWVNKIAGFIFFALLYLFIFSVLLFYASQLNLIHEQTVASSVSYHILHPLGPKVIEGLGMILPFFKDMFAQLLQFFDAASSDHTGSAASTL